MYFRLNNNVFSIGEKNVILYDISVVDLINYQNTDLLACL